MVTQRGRGQKPPSPGLIDAGAGGKGAARSSGARQGGEEEMDGQRQESRGRERRALGGELCACSAPEGAPRARGDESGQGSWEQPRLSGWRAVSGSWRGAGLGARRPGRSSSAARSPLSPPPPAPRQQPAAHAALPGGPWPSCPHPSLLAVPRAPATDFLASLALSAAKKVPRGPATCYPSAACEARRRLHHVADSTTPPARPASSWLARSPLLPGLPEHHPQSYEGKDPCSPAEGRGEVEAGGLCVSPVPPYYSHLEQRGFPPRIGPRPLPSALLGGPQASPGGGDGWGQEEGRVQRCRTEFRTLS